MKKIERQHIIIAIVLVIVAGGLGFWIGKVSGKRTNTAGFSMSGARNGMNTNFRARSGGGLNAGEVLSKDDKSITIKSPNGGSKNVFYSGSTSIMKSVVGTIDDVAVGSQIIVTGNANSDGSVTATSIQLRDANARPMMGPGR